MRRSYDARLPWEGVFRVIRVHLCEFRNDLIAIRPPLLLLDDALLDERREPDRRRRRNGRAEVLCRRLEDDLHIQFDLRKLLHVSRAAHRLGTVVGISGG